MFYPTEELRQSYSNTYKAVKNLYLKYGARGFYLGYFPHTMVGVVFYTNLFFLHNNNSDNNKLIE